MNAIYAIAYIEAWKIQDFNPFVIDTLSCQITVNFQVDCLLMFKNFTEEHCGSQVFFSDKRTKTLTIKRLNALSLDRRAFFFFSIDRSIFWVLPSWRCCNSMKNLMPKLPWTMDENRYRERPVKRLFLILTLWVNNDLHSPVLHSAGKSTTKALSIDRKNHCREKVWFSIF